MKENLANRRGPRPKLWGSKWIFKVRSVHVSMRCANPADTSLCPRPLHPGSAPAEQTVGRLKLTK